MVYQGQADLSYRRLPVILLQSDYATDGILKTEQALGLCCQPHCTTALLKLKH